MQILNGSVVAQSIQAQLTQEITDLKIQRGITPGLSVILVGEDPASQVYVSHKHKACQKIGIQSFEIKMPATSRFEEIAEKIKEQNARPEVHGILLQLPLPKGIDADALIEIMDPLKDADGLTICNMGYLLAARPRIKPCTPAGVMEVLKHYKIPVAGQNAVVIGRSQIVGRPMSQLLIQANATVTVCHTKTKDLHHYTHHADLVVVAAGQPRFLGKEAFKKGAVVIDVGVHRLPTGKLCGDVRFEELEGHAAAATPVPGGIGPMTITMLLKNTVELARLSQQF